MAQIWHTNSNTLTGTSGDDQIYGNKAKETLDGREGDDELKGGIGDDTLIGGAGNDTLLGGVGADNLTGGPGADRFQFRYYSESKISNQGDDPGRVGPDTITDFVTGEDKIDLVNLHLTPSQIVVTSTDATHHRVTVLINELPENNMIVNVNGNRPVPGDFIL
jgi:Ca2+-binding RTX toxin-like protein